MTKSHASPVFKTESLYEAAAINIFQKPLRLDNLGNRYLFVYLEKPAKELSSRYWTGKLKADLREYAKSLNELKDWIFAQRRQAENQFAGRV